MKRLGAALFASIATVGLLSACGDNKSASPGTASNSVPSTGILFPEETTTVPAPAGQAGVTVPQATIDQMIAQLVANGLKVDKACFTALLRDPALLKLVTASSSGTLSPDVIQKFIGCIGT